MRIARPHGTAAVSTRHEFFSRTIRALLTREGGKKRERKTAIATRTLVPSTLKQKQ